MATTQQPAAPMESLENWDEFLEGRYKEGKSEEEFRQYDKREARRGRVLPAQPRAADGRVRPGQGEGILRPEQEA